MLAVSFITALSVSSFHVKGERVRVYVDGMAVSEYSLSDEISIDIKGYGGGYNSLRISDGAAYMTDASCPDKLCIHQGKADRSGQSIVCLPNRVVVKVEGKDGNGYDAITR